MADGDTNETSSLVKQLTDTLAANMARVIDLFREWDDDENGLVSKLEFRRALPILGLKVERPVAEELFNTFDDDKSGEISYDELSKSLRASLAASSGVELDDALKAGSIEFSTESKNNFALRTGPAVATSSGALGSQAKLLTGEGAPPIGEQIRDALTKNMARVIDVSMQNVEPMTSLPIFPHHRHATPSTRVLAAFSGVG